MAEANRDRFDLVDASKERGIISPFKITEKIFLVPKVGAIQTCNPGGTNTWYVSGTQGSSVDISLERLWGTGGHLHSGGPVGSVSPSSFTLTGPYPQNVQVTFTAPDACGNIRQRGVFSDGTVDTDYNNVAYLGLEQLLGSQNIVLTGRTDSHPDNHYGTSSLVTGLRALALAFYQEFGKPLYVNDMSLVVGGLFDINDDWDTPHSTHRYGRNADLNRGDMSETERTFFENTAVSLGFTVEVHPSGEGRPPHWHITK